MKLATIQHKNVFEELIKNNQYCFKNNSLVNISEEYLKTYKYMNRFLKMKTKKNSLPIWCFKVLENDILDINNIFWKGKGPAINDDSVLIELEIDSKEILLTSYYDWTDAIYYSDSNHPEDIELFKISIRNSLKAKSFPLQAVISEINIENVIKVSNLKGVLYEK